MSPTVMVGLLMHLNCLSKQPLHSVKRRVRSNTHAISSISIRNVFSLLRNASHKRFSSPGNTGLSRTIWLYTTKNLFLASRVLLRQVIVFPSLNAGQQSSKRPRDKALLSLRQFDLPQRNNYLMRLPLILLILEWSTHD